jgi:hypothetical protein
MGERCVRGVRVDRAVFYQSPCACIHLPAPSVSTHTELLDPYTCLRDGRAGIAAGPGAASEAVGLGRLYHGGLLWWPVVGVIELWV